MSSRPLILVNKPQYPSDLLPTFGAERTGLHIGIDDIVGGIHDAVAVMAVNQPQQMRNLMGHFLFTPGKKKRFILPQSVIFLMKPVQGNEGTAATQLGLPEKTGKNGRIEIHLGDSHHFKHVIGPVTGQDLDQRCGIIPASIGWFRLLTDEIQAGDQAGFKTENGSYGLPKVLEQRFIDRANRDQGDLFL
jgi:hypothetical protein